MGDRLKHVSWKVMLAFAILLATIAISSAVGLIMNQLNQNNALSTCRSRYSVRVTSAEADVLIEQINLFVILANHGDVRSQLVTTNEKKTALVNAKDKRKAYEEHPVLPCPIKSNSD